MSTSEAPTAATQQEASFPPENFLPTNPYWRSTATLVLNAARGLMPASAVIIAMAEHIFTKCTSPALRTEVLEWLLNLSVTDNAIVPCARTLAAGLLEIMTTPAPPVQAPSVVVLHEDAQLPRGVKVGDVPKPKWSQSNSEWFKELEVYFRMHGPVTSDAHKLYLAVQAASQNRSLYTRLKLIQNTKPATTWDEVKRDILDSMYEKDATKTARDRLAALRQGNLSIEEYVSKFEMYCFEATDVSEAEKCDKFMRQMDPSLQREIMKAGDPKTYEEMRSLATRIDGRRRNPNYGRGETRNTRNNRDFRDASRFKTAYDSSSGFGANASRPSASYSKQDGPVPMDLNHAGSSKPPPRERLTFEEKKMYDAKGWCKYCRGKDHTVEHCKVKPSKPMPPKAQGPGRR